MSQRYCYRSGGVNPSLLSHQLTDVGLQTSRQKLEAGRWKCVACYLYLWHPVASCFVREVVGVVVILPGHKLQVLCFDIHGYVYKFDNIGGAVGEGTVSQKTISEEAVSESAGS